jgi:hypothetical protein
VSTVQAVIDRFGIKRADYLSLAPAIALPALGAYLGSRIGGPSGAQRGGALAGSLVGGVGGLAVREKMPHDLSEHVHVGNEPPMPDMDPTMEDVPAWALEGARVLKQAGILAHLFEKRAGFDPDVVIGEVPGAAPFQRGYEGWKAHGPKHGLGQAGKAFAGMTLGGVPGALLGVGAGKAIQSLTGRRGNVPLVNLPLDDILGGLGGSIGALKGLRHFTGGG